MTWIEQLASKRDHIGAAKTIAVSSTGFTGPAYKAAEISGIELRRFRDISDEDIVRQFLTNFSITMLVTDFRIENLGLLDFDGQPIDPDNFSEELRSKLTGPESLDAPLLREPATGYEITLREIGGSQVGKLQLKNSEKQTVKIELKFSRRAWTVDLRDGPKYVGLLRVVVTYTYQEKPVSPLSLRQYDGAGTGTIMEVVQGDAAISERERMRVYTFVKRGGEEQN